MECVAHLHVDVCPALRLEERSQRFVLSAHCDELRTAGALTAQLNGGCVDDVGEAADAVATADDQHDLPLRVQAELRAEPAFGLVAPQNEGAAGLLAELRRSRPAPRPRAHSVAGDKQRSTLSENHHGWALPRSVTTVANGTVRCSSPTSPSTKAAEDTAWRVERDDELWPMLADALRKGGLAGKARQRVEYHHHGCERRGATSPATSKGSLPSPDSSAHELYGQGQYLVNTSTMSTSRPPGRSRSSMASIACADARGHRPCQRSA